MVKLITHEVSVREISNGNIWEGENGRLHLVGYDSHAQNPRLTYDFLCKLICNFGRMGNYSDKGVDIETFREDVRQALGQEELPEGTLGDLARLMNKAGGFAAPVYGLNHTELHVSLSSFKGVDPHGWDSGVAGVIWANPQDIRDYYNEEEVDKDRLFAEAEIEIDILDRWLSGDVYCVKSWEASQWKKLPNGGYEVTNDYEYVDDFIGFEAVRHMYPPLQNNATP